MNIFKRSIISIKRNPGKSFLLVAMVFILGNVIAGAFSIRQSILNTEKRLWERTPPVATVDWIDHSIWATAPEALTVTNFQDISNLSYVSNADFNLYNNGHLMSKDLIRYFNPDWGLEDEQSLSVINQNILQGGATEYEHFRVRGVNNLDLMDIQAGLIQLSQGRTFVSEEENVAIISQNFANANNLVLGSSMQFDSIVFDTRGLGAFDYAYMLENLIFTSKTVELTVVGIFESITDGGQSLNPWESGEQEVLNRIYVPISLIEHLHPFHIQNAIYLHGHPQDLVTDFTSIFLLNDPRDMPSFAEAANEILPEGWQIAYIDNNFNQLIAAMDNMRWIADSVLLFAIGATLVTLTLLIILFIKDRKTEVGIYLSLGEKKHKIIGQILFEILSVATCALFLSFFSGNLIASHLSTHLLHQDLQQQIEEEPIVFGVSFESHLPQLANFDPGELSMEDMMEAFDTSLTPETMLLFFLVGTGIILSATIAPILYTMKMNPKEIML
ncbi:MAG: FtsX-like permease family protein [Turicibacter sp.]|nr:FtsX-like permease family protein [Turicibacter sp.]